MAQSCDLFVCHAASDNPQLENGKAWAQNMGHYFSRLYQQVIGEQPVIQISAQGPPPADCKAMLCILSPAFVTDPQAQKHYQQFVDAQGGSGLFKLVKHPVPFPDQPEQLQDHLGYEFYNLGAGGRIEEFDGIFDTEEEIIQYWLRLVDLSYEVFAVTHPEHKRSQAKAAKTVFLAETTADLSRARDEVKRELQRLGHTVLPDHSVPRTIAELKKEMAVWLKKSQLAIHIIGPNPGDTLDDGSTLLDVQNRVASDYCSANEGKPLRFLWISPDHQAETTEQTLYLENLKRDVDSQQGAEVIQTPLEVFKGIATARLQTLSNEKDAKAATDGLPTVYLIVDPVDEQATKKLVTDLQKQGSKVLLVNHGAAKLDLIHEHRQFLVAADGVMIYRDLATDQWLRAKLQDLVKAPGFGRRKPLRAKAVISPEVRDLPVDGPLYRDVQQLTESGVDDFVSKLRSA